jgi:hypothetical protein
MSDYCDINVSDTLDGNKVSENYWIACRYILLKVSESSQVPFIDLCKIISKKKYPRKEYCIVIKSILDRLEQLNLVCQWGRHGKHLKSGFVAYVGPGSICNRDDNGQNVYYPGSVESVLFDLEFMKPYQSPPVLILKRVKVRRDDQSARDWVKRGR